MGETNSIKPTVRQIESYLKSINIIKGRCFIFLVDKGIDSKNYFISVNNKNKFKYILKTYSKDNNEEVKYEIEILNKLDCVFKKKFFPIVFLNFFYINKKPSILLKYIPGRILSKKDISLYLIKEIAKKQAEMHHSFIDFIPKHKKHRFSIFDFSFFNIYVNNKSQYHNILQNEINILIQESESFKRMNYIKSIIHEDLSIENIILSKNGNINFIDFGDSHRAEIISDIATGIKELIINNRGLNIPLMKNYLDSYQKVFRLNKDEINLLPFLFRRRAVFIASYLLHKQGQDKNIKLRKKIDSEIKVLKNLQKNNCFINDFIKNYKYE